MSDLSDEPNKPSVSDDEMLSFSNEKAVSKNQKRARHLRAITGTVNLSESQFCIKEINLPQHDLCVVFSFEGDFLEVDLNFKDPSSVTIGGAYSIIFCINPASGEIVEKRDEQDDPDYVLPDEAERICFARRAVGNVLSGPVARKGWSRGIATTRTKQRAAAAAILATTAFQQKRIPAGGRTPGYVGKSYEEVDESFLDLILQACIAEFNEA